MNDSRTPSAGHPTGEADGSGDQPFGIRLVRTRSLGKRYGQRYALFGVDLEIQAGHPCVVMGPNGSGKSTLLNVLALLNRPSTGRVVHLDEENREVPAPQVRRQMGLLTHQPMTYGELTACENVRLFAQLYGRNGPTTCARQALAAVELDPDDSRPCVRYSHGMRRRLALARVLATDPGVVLLDEPSSGLDEQSVECMTRVLRTLSSRRVLLFSTHDTALAAALARHAVFLKSGRLAGQHRQDRFSAEHLARLYAQHLDRPVPRTPQDPAEGQEVDA